jgi:cycloeucalenol cycloisomerase
MTGQTGASFGRGPMGAWLGDDPAKAWGELFFLAQTPLWIAAVAIVIATGWIHAWGDGGYLAFGFVAAAPAMLGPLLLRSRPERDQPFWRSYWFRFNVWCFVLVAFGTYFGTGYFFDLMGMRYGFPDAWTLQAEVVGRGDGTVPVFMYPLTQAYFVTYFAVGVVVLRGLRRRFGLGRVGSAVVVAVLAYTTAFAETFFMANEQLAAYFSYADRDRMLTLGSFGYAIYFVVGLPMVYRMDEDGSRWPLPRVLLEALATCMMILVGLELWAKLVGPL